MWRGPLRRARGPVAPGRARLARARELLQRGDFGAAATLFEELAQGAEERGMLDAAGDLRMELARCYLEQGKTDRADDEARLALALFMRAGRPLKVRRVVPKVIAALEQHGRHAEAEELRGKAEKLLSTLPAGVGRGGPAVTLPGKCPNCAAPLKPNELSWVGPRSAECPYCGGVVSGTE